MKLSQFDRLIEFLPEDLRLANEAKSGDTRAFIKLYDAYVECVYRYVYTQVADDRVAEGITFQTFFTAWKQLGNYTGIGFPFTSWLYSIAQNQLSTYYRTHKNVPALEQDLLRSMLSDTGREVRAIRESMHLFTEEERQVLTLKYIASMSIKNIARLMSMREGDIRDLQLRALQILAVRLEERDVNASSKIQKILAECETTILINRTSTLEGQLALFPQYKADLAPLLRMVLSLARIRNVNPSPTFAAYTHEALLHHIVTHPRPQPQPKRIALSRQMSYAFTLLILLAGLFTGTVQAQSALPGQAFYPWKRVSEELWRVVSIDPVSAEIVLADRRLNEWMLVIDDPLHKDIARDDYLQALARLKSVSGTSENLEVIIPALQSQQQVLTNAGIFAPELTIYLSVVSSFVPTVVPTPTQFIPMTASLTPFIPTSTAFIPNTPTVIIPTDTAAPTETLVPTATLLPTETLTPTDIPPTATEVPPTATDVPTEIVPVDTPTPTEIIPDPLFVP